MSSAHAFYLAFLVIFIPSWVPQLARAENAVVHTDYDAHWIEAARALTAFANADLSRKGSTSAGLNAIYRRDSERYAAALASLAQRLPPAEVTQVHWQLLPLHEQVLAAMRLVVDARERNDEPRLIASWVAFRNAVKTLRRATETLIER